MTATISFRFTCICIHADAVENFDDMLVFKFCCSQSTFNRRVFHKWRKERIVFNQLLKLHRNHIKIMEVITDNDNDNDNDMQKKMKLKNLQVKVSI